MLQPSVEPTAHNGRTATLPLTVAIGGKTDSWARCWLSRNFRLLSGADAPQACMNRCELRSRFSPYANSSQMTTISAAQAKMTTFAHATH